MLAVCQLNVTAIHNRRSFSFYIRTIYVIVAVSFVIDSGPTLQRRLSSNAIRQRRHMCNVYAYVVCDEYGCKKNKIKTIDYSNFSKYPQPIYRG